MNGDGAYQPFDIYGEFGKTNLKLSTERYWVDFAGSADWLIVVWECIGQKGKHWWGIFRCQTAGGAIKRAGGEIPQYFLW